MKKVEENRYPHSATLFRFCKEALEIRYDGNVKVIDQDVGAILGYDPADCSHWKKGKKNIRSLATLRSIADHLKIDERLLIDIASGRINLEEALFEYKGYGDFDLQGRSLDSLKKEFFKNPTRWQKEGEGIKTFEELFDVDRPGVAKVAEKVLELSRFNEAPIYVPELYQLFPNLKLETNTTQDKSLDVRKTGENKSLVTTVVINSQEMRPYQRFLAAKEIYKFLCESKNDLVAKYHLVPKEVQDIQANIFVGILLVPGKILRTEVEKINGSYDLVTQLADTFWVSKALLNRRLRDYMENLS